MKTTIASFISIALIVLGTGCRDKAPLAPDRDTVDDAVTTAASVEEVTGTVGSGARYAFFVPDTWNGDLVLYVHGFNDPAAPIELPTRDKIEPLRDELLNLGYAVGYSSLSANGLAVKEGVIETNQLRGIFASRFGMPNRVYVTGHSLGGLVAINLIEKHPEHYKGALSMCGIIGGSQATVDYVANLRVLFDLFYPGVLPGTVVEIPEGVDLDTEVIGPIVAAISADPSGALAISQIVQTPVPFSDGAQLVESFVRALAFNFRGFIDILERTHGHLPFDNSKITYSGALPPTVLAWINASVQRYAGDVDALNALQQYYEPLGTLSGPAITLHNYLDPVAPFFHESTYAQKVADAGSWGWLSQRVAGTVYGHCEFSVPEMVEAFQDLAAWAESGATP